MIIKNNQYLAKLHKILLINMAFNNLGLKIVIFYLYLFAIFFYWLKGEFCVYLFYHQDNFISNILLDQIKLNFFSTKKISLIQCQRFLNFILQIKINHQIMFILLQQISIGPISFFIPDFKFQYHCYLFAKYYNFLYITPHFHQLQSISMKLCLNCNMNPNIYALFF